MEKKTIGKFIAVLRKANGMTQRELGEKLYVSDKTVSRWERDECTPELSLIPAIAEIFGITTDELLRGERKSPCSELADEAFEAKQKAKSDKQFCVMLHRKTTRFKYLSLISVGVSLMGLIASAVWKTATDIGFIGFFISLFFFIAAVICQLCFTLCARVRIDEDDIPDRKAKIENANTEIVLNTLYILTFVFSVFAFVLPLTIEIQRTYSFDIPIKYYSPISMGEWAYMGLMCSGAALCISHILYMFFFRRLLISKGLLHFEEGEFGAYLVKKKLLSKMCIIFAFTAIMLLLCVLILNILGAETFAKGASFDNPKDLQAYVNDISRSSETASSERFELISKSSKESAFAVQDENGKIIFGYTPNSNIHSIDFTSESKIDKDNPAVVYTAEAMNDAYDIFNFLQSMLYWLIVFDFIICAAVYLLKLGKIK